MNQIPARRGVVLTRSLGGLLAAAWLAERGVDVRVLSLPGAGASAPGLHRVAPDVARWLERFIGPAVSPGEGMETRWYGASGWRAAEKVALSSDSRAVAALQEAKLGASRLGEVRAHLRALTGTDAASVATRVLRDTHGTHHELRVPLTPVEQIMASLSERVRDAGGDVLDDVAIESFDVDEGCVMGVWSDHGLEHVEEVLWTDVGADALIEAGAPVARGDASHAEQLVVDIDVEQVDALPALGWVGRAGVPVARLERLALLPEASVPWERVRLWLCCAPNDARTLNASDLAGWLAAVLTPVVGPHRMVGLRHRQPVAWPSGADAPPVLDRWIRSRVVPLPGALPGVIPGLIQTAEWLMRLEGRPPAATTGRVWL